MRTRRPIAVVDSGHGCTAAWTSLGTVAPVPSLVAVDRNRRPLSHGIEAVVTWARDVTRVSVVRPIAAGDVIDSALARDHLRWALGEAGLERVVGTRLFLPLWAASSGATVGRWQTVVRDIGAHPVVVERPLAAAAGLGLELGWRAELVVELGDDLVEVAALSDSGVTTARLVRRTSPDLCETATAIGHVLAGMDPDDELTVRDNGVHVHGWRAEQDAPALRRLIGIPVTHLPSRPGLAVVEGTRRIALETVGAGLLAEV